MKANIVIRFGNSKEEYICFPALKDEISIDCGDFSEERLAATLAEMTRKFKKAWRYMADRELPSE